MKNLFLLFIIVVLFSCTSEESKEITSETEVSSSVIDQKSNVYDVMFNDLMLLDAGGMYRGLDFDMNRTQVKRIELDRSTTTELSSEKEAELIITSDLGDEVLDFADIKYTFDENGLYFISAESYLITEEKAKKLYDMLKDHFTKIHGEGVEAVDGFLDFTTKSKKYDYQISIKEVNYPPTETQKGSYGFYLVYSLVTDK